MKVTIGKAGLTKTHQADFPETISRFHLVRGSSNSTDICNGESRIAFVAHEGLRGDDREQPFICNLHENKYDEGEAWLHDCCAVAVYFCKKCLHPTALYNQG